MAIIDLGKVSITWKGAYAGGTAYTPKDAVVYNNASYICIANTTGNLPTDTTYWNVMAAKGVDGTDLTSTLTTQGDVVYRDGSGLARLGFGTDGHVLTTKGTGANPIWAAAAGGGKVLQVVTATDNTERSTTSASWGTADNTLSVNITPSATLSKVLVMTTFNSGNSSGSDTRYTINRDATNIGDATYGIVTTTHGDPNAMYATAAMTVLDSPSSTSALTYQVYVYAAGGTAYINRYPTLGTITVMEIGA